MVIAVIGLGEVGSRYSVGMAKRGAKVKGYDIKFHDPKLMERFLPYGEQGVELANSPRELIEGSDIVISVTSCHEALETAEMYLPYLTGNQYYVDLNSSTPTLMHDVDRLLAGVCKFVDGASMNSITHYGIDTPVVVSGEHAGYIAAELSKAGMKVTVLGAEIGQASAYKVIRSIFIKNCEAALMESLCAARRHGIAREVFDSICDMIGNDTPEVMATMIRTNVIQSKRRADEVEGVAVMQQEEGLENTMSLATVKKLNWLATLGLQEKFDHRVAQDMYEVLDAVLANM